MRTIVSGIQPTGRLHIGNYLGALKNWVTLQKNTDDKRFFFIADLHAMTDAVSASERAANVIMLTRDLLALGIDPKKSCLFLQSDVPEHTKLFWIFSTLTPMSELNKMTQYKDKSAHAPENINAGLFAYPVLQAADILLYHGTHIPVGEDQVQHVELTRVIAKKCNARYGTDFPLTQPLLTEIPRVMSLTEPTKKMSKSHGEKTCLFLTDNQDALCAKTRKATVDDAGINNLLELVRLFDNTGATYNHVKKEHAAGTLKNIELKESLAELVDMTFAHFRAEREKISDATVRRVLEQGATHAREVAHETMQRVKKSIGL